jgi:hypothetical protein
MKITIKIPAKKIASYLRELSIVIVGIAITLSINNRLTTRNEKKDMTLYLNAVKLELEANLEDLEWLTENVEKEISYFRYLSSYEKNSLDPDSIRRYAPDYSIVVAIAKDNAFKMFKTSGTCVS